MFGYKKNTLTAEPGWPVVNFVQYIYFFFFFSFSGCSLTLKVL